MKKQSLYQHFEYSLFQLDDHNEEEDTFVARVAEEYLRGLVDEGYHLCSKAEEVFEEIQTEVREMLRKKTYGHFSLKAFRTKKPGTH